MRIKKGLELHLATGESEVGGMQYDVIRVSDDGRSLQATDGVVLADVRIGEGIELEPGEELVAGAVIEPRAWAEAVRGSVGEGTLRLQFGAQVACSGDRKPAMHFAPPSFLPDSERPPLEAVLDVVAKEYAESRTLDLILDPEALYRLARALDAGSGGVRIRVPLDAEGRVKQTLGVVVEPAEDADGRRGLIMPISREGR